MPEALEHEQDLWFSHAGVVSEDSISWVSHFQTAKSQIRHYFFFFFFFFLSRPTLCLVT